MTVVLLVVGVVSEFAGIVLLAFPDFVPAAIRLSGWLRRQGRRMGNLVRRISSSRATLSRCYRWWGNRGRFCDERVG